MRHPSTAEVEEIAADLNISFTDEELTDYAQIVSDTIGLLERVEEIPKPNHPPTTYEHDRGPGYRPDDEEDPHNAWITKCEIKGDGDGPLSGMTVGLKDNVSLAGIEMTNGSVVMEGYVPDADATIVSRLLDAGSTITGKTNMSSFSLGASDFGPAQNPAAPEFSVGGSSSGSATAVAAGEVDIGIGGDQGGSIRIPASFAGIVGLKATHGLIPYTGILGADASLDHTGPMTRTVEEAALATEVLAGRDGLDPRQPHDLELQSYTDALGKDISDMTIAILKEGFEHDVSDEAVNETVYDAIDKMQDLGAEIKEVSVPGHLDSVAINFSILLYGTGQALKQNGTGSGFDGWYDTTVTKTLGRALTTQSNDLPASIKNSLVVTEYIQRNYQGSVYGKAQNITLELRKEYDEILTNSDAIVMPTSPVGPPPFGELMGRQIMKEHGAGFDIAKNTALFDVTHHPALTVPCGKVDGAPVGLMFVGNRFDEATLFKLGYAYEQSIA